jgi:hypothetical protein
MIIGPINRILGHIIDNHWLMANTPNDFLTPLWHHLATTWGPHCQSFTILEAETLAGQLGHVSFASPWLKHLMPHIYHSLVSALTLNHSHLISSSASFHFVIKQIKQSAYLPSSQAACLCSFYQADLARTIHHTKTQHHISHCAK